MKNTIYLFIGLLLLNCGTANSKEKVKYNRSPESSISIYCTQDLYNLTTKLASEYCSLNPGLKIEVRNVSESTISKTANVGRNLRFISDELYPVLNDGQLWEIVVGRDVIVPIINSKNPFLDKIYKQGISSKQLAQIFKNPEIKQWGTLLDNGQNVPVNYYIIDDESINSSVTKFLKIDDTTIDGIKVENQKELISSIQKDPYALGFCKMINIVDFSNQSIVEDIKILPIDRNGNGEIDYIENIYDDLNVFSRGVWIGKYPVALINNIYAIAPIKPTDETEVGFLKWVLTANARSTALHRL